jgi:hypothetical protein
MKRKQMKIKIPDIMYYLCFSGHREERSDVAIRPWKPRLLRFARNDRVIRFSVIIVLILGFGTCSLGETNAFDPSKVRNVKDFGAKGDGVTDDTEAIQKAIGPGYGITYFPSGTYVVSRELKVWGIYGGAHLLGDYSGNRPVLLLKAGTPGFGDPTKPGYVVRFYEHGPPKPKTAWCDTYGSQFEGIDIRMDKNNPGAIGVYHPSAQTSYIRNCTITMDGNLVGIAWLPGDSVNENLTIIGGKIGIQIREGQWPNILRGCTFKGQTVAAIEPYQCGLVLQGCLFDGCAAGIFVPSGSGIIYPAARLYLEDCIFSNIRSGKAVNGQGGERYDWLMVMKNVYFKDVPLIAHWSNPQAGHIAGKPSGWCRADFVVHGNHWENGVKIGGDGANFRKVTPNVQPPTFSPKDYVDRFPTKPECVNVKTEFGAHGDGVHDDTDAIRTAIDKSSKPIWFPIGTYRVRDTIQLKKDTKLIGEHAVMTVIQLVPAAGDKSFNDPAHPKPLIDTVDDANGTAVFAHFGSAVYIDDPATKNTMEFDGLIGIRWRVGRHSRIDDIFSFNVVYRGERQTGYAPVMVTGHGGGHLRNIAAPWAICSGPGQLVIDGTSEPLDLYGMSFEHCKGKPEVSITNSRNITFWQLQSEGGLRVIEAQNSRNLSFRNVFYNQFEVLPVSMRFTQCRNVELYCCWRYWSKYFKDVLHFNLDGKNHIIPETGIAVWRWINK